MLTERKLDQIYGLFYGEEKIGDRYSIPIQFVKVAYITEKAPRDNWDKALAVCDLFFASILHLIFIVLRFFITKYRFVIDYIQFEDNRRKIQEVAFIDWHGEFHENIGRYRQREPLVQYVIEVDELDLKNKIIKLNK